MIFLEQKPASDQMMIMMNLVASLFFGNWILPDPKSSSSTKMVTSLEAFCVTEQDNCALESSINCNLIFSGFY